MHIRTKNFWKEWWIKIGKKMVSLESNWNTAALWINGITRGKTITWNMAKFSAIWPMLRYCLNWTISIMTLSILYGLWPLFCLHLLCRLFHPRNRNTSAPSSGILVNVDGISLDRIDQLALQLIWNSLVSNQMVNFQLFFFSPQKMNFIDYRFYNLKVNKFCKNYPILPIQWVREKHNHWFD